MHGGITAFGPLYRNRIGPGSKVAIVGIGGIGHFGVIFGKHFGAEVYAFSTHNDKKEDVLKMGAHRYISLSGNDNLWVEELHDQMDLMLIATNSFTGLDWEKLIHVMKMGGKIVSAAEPPFTEKLSIRSFALMGVSIECISVRNFKEIDIMTNTVAENDLKFWIETMPITDVSVGEAFRKMNSAEARYKITLVDYHKQFGTNAK
jgi:alcohol dehydrogenase (NADP+)